MEKCVCQKPVKESMTGLQSGRHPSLILHPIPLENTKFLLQQNVYMTLGIYGTQFNDCISHSSSNTLLQTASTVN